MQLTKWGGKVPYLLLLKCSMSCPIYGMWGSRKTSWDGAAKKNLLHRLFFKKWANPGLFLYILAPFPLQFQYKLEKSIEGVLGIRTRGHRMVGADETTELWRPPSFILLQKSYNPFSFAVHSFTSPRSHSSFLINNLRPGNWPESWEQIFSLVP